MVFVFLPDDFFVILVHTTATCMPNTLTFVQGAPTLCAQENPPGLRAHTYWGILVRKGMGNGPRGGGGIVSYCMGKWESHHIIDV